ncbi:MAG: alpha/beta hydrolase [Planctomycetota bacterium]|nr:MAG: alpha/beta hydrolase [Planctomycetota bacterium]
MQIQAMTTRRCAAMVCLVVAVCLVSLDGGASRAETWYRAKTTWNGFDRFEFEVAGRKAYVVVPAKIAESKPWIWRARFPDYHAEMDVALVRRGFHIGYVDVAGLYGSPKAMEIGDAFYRFVTERLGLSSRPVLEGVSRGGLFVYNWAARHPDRVACIYADTPVLDIRSWPGGKGRGEGSEACWRECLEVYGLTEETAVSFSENPIDHAAIIAKARIPILHVVSDNDRIVPPAENTDLFAERLRAAGGTMEIMRVAQGTESSGGHHFPHPDPDRVVRFILSHTKN